MHQIRVNLKERSYPIALAEEKEKSFSHWLEELQIRSTVLISDRNIAPQVSRLGLDRTHRVITIESGESQKSLQTVEQISLQLLQHKVDRQTTLLALGGGVIGDLVGFVASVYNRGISFIMIPTTLLAMVDSSVGGKVGVNLPGAKNILGSFYQPNGVWIDIRFLDSLPDREFRSGLAEVVKYGMILDESFLAWLETSVDAILNKESFTLRKLIRRCCEQKANIVEKDERETTGLRMILNYGHTFAHAFETVFGYGTLLHGEAVSLGMICAAQLAVSRRMIPDQIVDRQRRLLRSFGLPTSIHCDGKESALLESMRSDKKNSSGNIRFILPKRIGEVVPVDGIPDDEIITILKGIKYG